MFLLGGQVSFLAALLFKAGVFYIPFAPGPLAAEYKY
jgi:hypothetical protein